MVRVSAMLWTSAVVSRWSFSQENVVFIA